MVRGGWASLHLIVVAVRKWVLAGRATDVDGGPSEGSAYYRLGCARTICRGVRIGWRHRRGFQRRLCPDHREILQWIAGLPAPVAVTYEAGPTGFGLARALTDAGIDCRVAAPSKLQRPAGDRVKTDARDAAHLARLLHLGQIVEVTVPSVAQEAARDLARAREDCRKS